MLKNRKPLHYKCKTPPYIYNQCTQSYVHKAAADVLDLGEVER